jgi:hypothetical protein
MEARPPPAVSCNEKRSPWPTTEEELADFWAHKVFQKSLILSTTIFGFAAIILSAAAWLLMTEIGRRAESQVQSTVAQKVNERIEIEARAIRDKYKQEFDREIETTNKEMTALRAQIKGELETFSDYLQSRQQLNAKPAILPADAVPEETCTPSALTDSQRALLAVTQEVSATSQKSGDHSLFNNRFQLALAENESPESAPVTLECLAAAVDRVVYSLNPLWFKPSRNVRTDPATRFAYEVLVWGRTPIEIEIFLINNQGRICLRSLLERSAEAETAVPAVDCSELQFAR